MAWSHGPFSGLKSLGVNKYNLCTRAMTTPITKTDNSKVTSPALWYQYRIFMKSDSTYGRWVNGLWYECMSVWLVIQVHWFYRYKLPEPAVCHSCQGTALKTVWATSSWWHHDMETHSALLALCEGNPPFTGGFPSQRASNVELSFCCIQTVWAAWSWRHHDVETLSTFCIRQI